MPTSLVLVRHGDARAGVEHFVGGPNGCKGLTDRGRRQARQLRDRLPSSDEIVPDVVLSSTLRRAVETAEIVSTAFPARQPLTDCDYCEQRAGQTVMLFTHGGFVFAAMFLLGAPGIHERSMWNVAHLTDG